MANSKSILDKVARNLKIQGIDSSRVGNNVVVDNGANDITISYVDASISSPMGGIDSSVSPYLGIGISNPGAIKMTSAIHAVGNIKDVIDGAIAAIIFHELCGFANNVILENDNASFSLTIQGHADLLNLGQ